jgi:hypothetical protein
VQRQGDQHPDDLVDDDRPRIDPSEMMLGFSGTPKAHDGDDCDRSEFDGGGCLSANQIVDSEPDC